MSIEAVARVSAQATPVRAAAQQPVRPRPMPLIPMDQLQIKPLSTDNPWKLDLHTGHIELSALFTRKKGEITQADKDGFKMQVEDQAIAVMTDAAAGEGHVKATLKGNTQGGVITKNGNTSSLKLDDGSTISITQKSGGHFSVTGIAPVTVDVHYLDAPPEKPQQPGTPASKDAHPWYLGQDPSSMSVGQKVKTIFKSLFTTSGQ